MRETNEGKVYNNWTVLKQFTIKRGTRRITYLTCKCKCGKIKDVRSDKVRLGETKSCGCVKRSFYHGMSGTLTYDIWAAMKYRCEKPDHSKYKDYGGRGIKVCERWHTFTNFLEDMGEKPDNLSLDRIDVNGNYCPENCRWATKYEQANNTRKNIFFNYYGVMKTAAEISRIENIGYFCVRRRVDKDKDYYNQTVTGA